MAEVVDVSVGIRMIDGPAWQDGQLWSGPCATSRVLATVILGFTLYYFIGGEMMPLADVGLPCNLIAIRTWPINR